MTADIEVADDLATALFALKVEGRSTALMTAHITRKIVGDLGVGGHSVSFSPLCDSLSVVSVNCSLRGHMNQ